MLAIRTHNKMSTIPNLRPGVCLGRQLHPCFRASRVPAMSREAHLPDDGIAVIAFGGNALLKRGEDLTMDNQRHNARGAAEAVAGLVANDGLRVCLTHGNGPQVGLLAQVDAESGLDVLDAESEGQIGYILESELANALLSQDGPEVATLLTQVLVDPADPAFAHPTKPIGRWYSRQEAEKLAAEKGWMVAADGDKFRRVVASPAPTGIVELKAIRTLLAAGMIVICCGGGGIPVAQDGARRRGVEAVVDKDAASALLAAELGAAWLVMLTDAEAVFDPAQWPHTKVPLRSLKASEIDPQSFPAGSMRPKLEAACAFVRRRKGGRAAVGNIADLPNILRGKAGTIIEGG